MKSIWRFGSLDPLGPSNGLLNTFQEQRTRGVQNLTLVLVVELDLMLLSPIAEVCHVRTVVEVRPEAATPAHEVLRVQIRSGWRSIE
jgi:hypothetical protein